MDIEYVHARVFLHSRYRLTSSHAIFDYLRQSEEALMSRSSELSVEQGAASTPEAALPGSSEESHEQAVQASNARVWEWLADAAAAQEQTSPRRQGGCMQAVASCPFRVCP